MRWVSLPILMLASCSEPETHSGKTDRADAGELVVTVSPHADPSRCGEIRYSHLKGQPLNMANTAIPPPSPGVVRYVYPRDLDFVRSEKRNQDRLNLEINASGFITRVYCG